MYQIPGDLFQVPTGYVWIFTARLVTGKGLPYMAQEWAIGAAILFAILTVFRIYAANKSWQVYIPGGIAVAVGECPTFRYISEYSNQEQEYTMFPPLRWLGLLVVCWLGTGDPSCVVRIPL